MKPWLTKRFCIPPEANEEFVVSMEDVLDVYQRPYDPRFPQLCMDEGNKQLLGEVREPIPMEKGNPKREDNEYKREGVFDIFGACEPLTGKYFFNITESLEKAKEKIMAWQEERNQSHVTINWRFTTEDARIKLKRLYPLIEG